MSEGEGGKFLRLTSVIIDSRRKAPFLYRRQINLKLCIQMKEDIFRIFLYRDRRIQSGEITDLFRGDRADAGEAGIESFCGRSWLFCQHGDKFFPGYGQRICFVHGVRDKIFPSGEHLTHRTHLGGHMLDAVNDLPVFCTEDDIAVLSHDLHDQELLAKVSKFVQMLDGKPDDPLQLGLADIDDPAVSNMLSQEHAEVGCGHGRRFVRVSQIDQWEGGVRADQEAFLPLRRLDSDQKLVRFRLDDAGDPSV